MRNNQKGTTVLILVIAVIFGLTAFAVWRYSIVRNSPDTSTPKQNNIQTEPSEVPEGFMVYRNTEAGFSFAYPQKWGMVEIRELDSPGKGDSYLLGTFSENSKVFFGGDRKDYSHDGRGLVPTDHPGYVKQDGSYFSYTSYGGKGGLEELRSPKGLEEIKAVNTTGLYQKIVLFGDESDSMTAYDLMRFNLNRGLYFGVNFVMESGDKGLTAEFTKLGQSFTLIN